MDGQQIRLRWTSHQGTVLSIFDVLLASESFVDVTLACEGQYIRAHRVILSACSPYFQKLLDVDTSKHPIFFLKDVKYTELKALVEYMYRGEVSIAHEELTSLLAVAQALMVRGLADVETTTNSISSDTIILPDIGSKRPVPKPTPLVAPITAVPSPPPMTPPAPAAPIVIPPSTVQLTRIVPTRPFPSATITSASVAAATISAPPVQKKPRLEPKLPPTTQVTQVQINTHAVDPLLDVHMPVVTPPVLDPLRPTASATTAGYCQASAVSENETFAQLEEPEVYGGQEVKIESESLPVEVDLDEETQGPGDNTMNQTNFSERFQLGEDNNLGKSEEPDPCGNNDEGAEAAGALTGGSDGEDKPNVEKIDSDEVETEAGISLVKRKEDDKLIMDPWNWNFMSEDEDEEGEEEVAKETEIVEEKEKTEKETDNEQVGPGSVLENELLVSAVNHLGTINIDLGDGIIIPLIPTPKKKKTKKVKKAASVHGDAQPPKPRPIPKHKEYMLSPELSAVVGQPIMTRQQVVKQMYKIIKEKDLYDPTNKQFAICNEELFSIFGVERFRTFGMLKYLNNHFLADFE